MHVVYIDEVKYDQASQRYYWLCGLAFPDRSIQQVDKTLSDLALSYFGTSILDSSTEFHAKHILHGKGPYKGHLLPRRIGLFKTLLDVIDEASGLGRIEIRIDPGRMVAAKHTDKAFMFFVEKIDEYMNAQKSLALLIADHDKEIAGENVASLSAYKARGTSYAFGRPITRVVDTIHHTHSHQSRLLQLADVYVYTLAMISGDCTSYPRSELAAYAKAKQNLLFPTKYKLWPTEDTWLAATE